MRLVLSEAERVLREEVKAFVAAELPDIVRAKVEDGAYVTKAEQVAWQKALHVKGWIAPGWPVERGGAGWSASQRCILKNQLEICGAPLPAPYGIDMIGPVIYTFGTAEQQARYLPTILSSDEWWCQGFSEPNAGSDLASLLTAAIDQGDHYVVTGQKIWTSKAHYADFMFLLARTERTERRQDGLSMLLLDMKAPGVTVRPIRSIDGDHNLNEVFLDGVVVPKTNLIGEPGSGWRYAKFMLGHERTAVAGVGRLWGRFGRIQRVLSHYEAQWPRLRAAHVRRALAAFEVDLVSLDYFEVRMAGAMGDSGHDAAPSMLKIAGTELQQRLNEIAIEVLGPHAAMLDAGAGTAGSLAPPFGSGATRQHLYGRSASIYGGTNEIQRDIVAKLLLD